MSKSDPTPSEQVRAAIRESGLSYNALAKLTGVDVAALHRFATDEDRTIRLNSVDKLAPHLGLRMTRTKRGRR